MSKGFLLSRAEEIGWRRRLQDDPPPPLSPHGPLDMSPASGRFLAAAGAAACPPPSAPPQNRLRLHPFRCSQEETVVPNAVAAEEPLNLVMARPLPDSPGLAPDADPGASSDKKKADASAGGGEVRGQPQTSPLNLAMKGARCETTPAPAEATAPSAASKRLQATPDHCGLAPPPPPSPSPAHGLTSASLPDLHGGSACCRTPEGGSPAPLHLLTAAKSKSEDGGKSSKKKDQQRCCARKVKAARRLSFDDGDDVFASSPVSGTVIRRQPPEPFAAGGEEAPPSGVCGAACNGGDIDPARNVVEVTEEARSELARIENRIGDFVCRLCGTLFGDAFGLARHRCAMILHVEYRCRECGKTFSCPANLASHQRWHRPRPPGGGDKDSGRLSANDPPKTPVPGGGVKREEEEEEKEEREQPQRKEEEENEEQEGKEWEEKEGKEEEEEGKERRDEEKAEAAPLVASSGVRECSVCFLSFPTASALADHAACHIRDSTRAARITTYHAPIFHPPVVTPRAAAAAGGDALFDIPAPRGWSTT